MRLDLTLDGQPATFERSGMTGRAALRVGDRSVQLQSPWNPRTHVGLGPTRTWTVRLDGRDASVSMQRARFFAGARDAHYVIRVDGEEVVSGTGY